MVESHARTTPRHGLSFLATLAFVGGFFGARGFHLLFPNLMVITGGVHFHHFWYGLTMMGVSGWLGIAYHDEKLNRIYAVVFGTGAGFVGDEVGLLLTFDNYYTELTFLFFVAAISFVILAILLAKYWKQVAQDLFGLTPGERLTHVGIFLVGFSALFAAFDLWYASVALAVLGIAVFAWGYARSRKERATAPAGP